MRGPFVAAGLVFSLLWPAGAVALQKPSAKNRVLPDFDSRAGMQPSSPLVGEPKGEPLERIRATVAGPLRMRIRAGTGAVRVLWAEGEPLSPAGGDAPAPAAERFINENGSLLGLEGAATSTLSRTREDALMGGALTRVVFEQVVDGIPVFEGVVWAHVDRLGRVVKLASGPLHRGGGAEERKALVSLSAEGAFAGGSGQRATRCHPRSAEAVECRGARTSNRLRARLAALRRSREPGLVPHLDR